MDKQARLEFNRRNIAEFRSAGGRIASFGGAPVLLLTTRGARSGLPWTSPLMYLDDERDPSRVYVFASAAGRDANPAWYHNLLASPDDLTVEIGPATFSASAEVLREPLRSQVFARQARRYPSFASYQARTSRRIPVIALTLRNASQPNRPSYAMAERREDRCCLFEAPCRACRRLASGAHIGIRLGQSPGVPGCTTSAPQEGEKMGRQGSSRVT